MIKNVVGMYFSPSGATAKITKKITIELTDNMRDSCLDDLSYSFYDMLCLSERHGINTSIDCTDETIVVMGLPVMSGRIPEICKEMLSKVNGNGAYLIALVSYGNNSYGDALYELYTYANERGFNVISAAAFIAQHSMFPKVAESRPDANDIKKMIEFSRIEALCVYRHIVYARKTRSARDSWVYSKTQADEAADSPYSEFSVHKLRKVQGSMPGWGN